MMNNKPTALYRHYDQEGTLLYVGIALSPFKRFNQHQHVADWTKKAVSMRTEWFDDRRAALEAETKAIKTERPLFNVTHNNTKPASKCKPALSIEEKKINFKRKLRERLRVEKHSFTEAQKHLFLTLIHMFEDGETKYYVDCKVEDAVAVFRFSHLRFVVINNLKFVMHGGMCVFGSITREGDGTLFSTTSEVVDIFIHERYAENALLTKNLHAKTKHGLQITIPCWR